MSVSQFVFSKSINARGYTNVAVCESVSLKEGEAVVEGGVGVGLGGLWEK